MAQNNEIEECTLCDSSRSVSKKPPKVSPSSGVIEAGVLLGKAIGLSQTESTDLIQSRWRRDGAAAPGCAPPERPRRPNDRRDMVEQAHIQ